MYCGKCGTKNDDTAAFCEACGAPLKPPVPQGAAAQAVTVPRSNFSGKGKLAAIVAGAVVIVLAAWMLLGGRGYKATVEQFFDAAMEGDIDGIIDTIPPDLIDYAKKNEDLDDEELETLVQQIEGQLQRIDGLLSGVGIEITGDSDITGDELKELQEEYREYDVKVKEAKNVDVTISLDAGLFSDSEDVEVPVVKVGRSWYIDISSM